MLTIYYITRSNNNNNTLRVSSIIPDVLNLHLSGGVEDIHVKDGYIGRIPTMHLFNKILKHLN